MRQPIARWMGHAARKPNDVMDKQLFFAHSIPGRSKLTGCPHLTWTDTAMHDKGTYLLPADTFHETGRTLYQNVWRAGVVTRSRVAISVLCYFLVFISFHFCVVVGGLGFEFCVHLQCWWEACFRSEWPWVSQIMHSWSTWTPTLPDTFVPQGFSTWVIVSAHQRPPFFHFVIGGHAIIQSINMACTRRTLEHPLQARPRSPKSSPSTLIQPATVTMPAPFYFIFCNRCYTGCYKPLSNLEVSRARPNKEPFGYNKEPFGYSTTK